MVLTLVFCLAILGGLAAWSQSRFGSIGGGMAYLRGERLIADAYEKGLDREVGGGGRVAYRLTNVSPRPIRIVGFQSSCGCTTLSDLPLTIPPSESRPLVAKIQPKPGASSPIVTLRVYTDDPSKPELRLVVVGLGSQEQPVLR